MSYMKDGFEEWLRNYPDHKYTEGTIKRYIRALEKTEEWFDISLTKSTFEINDYQEFNRLQTMIKALPQYAEINRNHGHGDFSAAVKLYEKFLRDNQTEPSNEWRPLLSDYNPAISKEKWLSLLNNLDIFKTPWKEALAMFYSEKDGATCSFLAAKYNRQPMSISGTCTQMAKRVHLATNCPLASNDENDQYWPILFQGRPAGAKEPGSFVWRLRKELYDALTEYDILRFLPEVKAGEMISMKPKEAVKRIREYILSRGFSYPDGMIDNFYLSLKSKPFVILAGTSGTGKTRLVKLFAEAIGAEYYLVPVRPDWSDGSDLFGHYDLNGEFKDGPVCKAFDAAISNPDKPVILCLDEMNLARVEYYLSDFLSVIESREKAADGTIVTVSCGQYKGGIPDNLYIIGTVNMDETTFPFSKKVLDRANTIEFSFVNLEPVFGIEGDEVDPLQLSNSFLKSEYLVLAKDCAAEAEYVTQICEELQALNEILARANAHVGYRVRDEIVFYLLNNKNADYLLTEEQAMDKEIMQKILPRIQGSSASIKDLLLELFKFCMNGQSIPDLDNGNVGKQMKQLADNAKFPDSAKKIGFMMERYEEDGFTSYWL